MKVAQNDETIPDTQPVRPPHSPNLSNLQLSPLRLLCPKTRNPGNTSRMLPPFTGITSYRVRTRLALPVILLCTCLLCTYYFSPLFSSVDPVTMLMPLWSTTSPTTPLSCLSNQASPPLISRYRLLYSLPLALDFATVIVCSYSDA